MVFAEKKVLRLAYQGSLLAGVDEAGRGPLAGDVFSAAVILHPENIIFGLADSKKLSEKRRQELAVEIKEKALCWNVARSTVKEIDRFNILEATMMAMERAVEGLRIDPEYVVVDGNRLPLWRYASESIIKGDDKVPSISAASILAKVHRDEEMIAFDKLYPGYGFDCHKGYGTKKHFEAIGRLGPSLIHRKSFEPFKSMDA
ncbi:MAG: ribonuclease HII [Porticoccus sp.]|uniref:ribonuclease HII n=1 Tax=Porticoccus sp. Uisw_050_02 TaxID=3230978 RepID=UPI003095E5E4